LTRKFRLLLASLLSFGWLLAIPAANAVQGLDLEVYNCYGYNQSPPEGCNTTGQPLGVVPYINFNDGGSGPLGLYDDYQYHWFGYLQQTNGLNVQFRVCSDDGMRLYLDGQLIVNNWIDRGGQCGLPVSYAMTNSNWVPIDVWFYENGGGSNGSLQWNTGSGWEVVPSSVFSTSYASPAPYLNSPTNLSASIVNDGVSLTWSAPEASGTTVERYAIGWETADGGWGWAHDQTNIVVDYNTLRTSSGLNKNITFKIRSDNDSLAVYSGWSNTVTLYVAEPYVAAPLPFNYTYRVDENGSFSINAPSGKMIETITAWYGDPNDGNYGALVTDTLTASHSGETTTVIYANNDVFGDPVPGVGKILIANVTFIDLPGPTLEEIAAQQEAESETARQNQANAAVLIYETATMTSLSNYNPITALKDAAQSLVDLVRNLAAKAGFQSRIDYKSASINDTKVRLEAEQAAIVAEAARLEQERLAAIAAAQAAAEAQARAEAQAAAEAKAKAEQEAKEKAEAEAKAEEERLKAEAEAKAEEERLKAEQEAKEKAEAEEKAKIEAEEKAKAEQEAKEKAEAEAKAEEERLKAEAEAEAKAEEEAKAKAEEDRIKAEEEAKLLEEKEKAAAEEKAKEEELNQAEEDAKDGKELTEEQKEVVVEALLEDLKPGEAVTAAAIAASGISYSDLPPETPVELRTDINGNEVVITAEVAAQVELITDPGAFAQELFSDPGAALAALGSIGADMSDEERKESTEAVVATVIAAGAAINAVGAATAGGAPSGGSTGGGNSGGSGNGSAGSRRNEKW
jgi:hypothetical protein